ncbi:putative autophagy related lipase atg15 [Diplodia seriata]|uniref:triacylglycerol lipase n=1 Tax=Diplodia seriata TaxID=420778 RepID=A0A0G2EDJ2_9PEZI|nr:putative autophagy related lipase atg15 [Diplodia seriata]
MTTQDRFRSSAGRAAAAFVTTLLSLAALQPAQADLVPQHGDGSGILPVLPPGAPDEGASRQPLTRDMDFTLKHIFHHGTHKYPGLHRRLDIHPDAPLWVASEDDPTRREPAPPLRARSQALNIERLADRSPEAINHILETKRLTGRDVVFSADAWTVDEIAGPNVTDKESVLTFARMAANAYVTDPTKPEWSDVRGGFNYTEDFGWESDGLRGHIFADTENSTVVIGLKGTSPAVFDGSETTTNDKVNDNLFFGCCCGQGGSYMWLQVCDCMTSTYSCNSTCLVESIKEKGKNRYYYAVQDLYHNVTALYPDADVWISGHSLGGATGSLLGLSYGLPNRLSRPHHDHHFDHDFDFDFDIGDDLNHYMRDSWLVRLQRPHDYDHFNDLVHFVHSLHLCLDGKLRHAWLVRVQRPIHNHGTSNFCNAQAISELCAVKYRSFHQCELHFQELVRNLLGRCKEWKEEDEL